MGQGSSSLLTIVKNTRQDNKQNSLVAIQNLASQDPERKLIPSYIEKGDDDGRTALHWAALGGYDDIVSLLLDLSANVESKDNSGCTPLVSAVFRGNAKTAQLLITKGGADINTQNADGMTPLHWAILEQHYNCIELLIERGADSMNLRNSKGQNALEICTSLKTKKRIRMETFLRSLLEKKGVKLPKFVEPPIHPAVSPIKDDELPESSVKITPPTPSLAYPFTHIKTSSSPALRVSVSDFVPSKSIFKKQTLPSTFSLSLSSTSLNRRLLILCKVWGLCKFIHPSLVDGNISQVEWDSALIKAIPKMNAVKTISDYKNAMNELLEELNDATSRCYDVSEEQKLLASSIKLNGATDSSLGEEQPCLTKLDDGIQLLSATYHEKLTDYSRMSLFKEAFSQITKDNKVIFDFRLKKGMPSTHNQPFRFMLFECFRSILNQDVSLPSFRQRVFNGFPQNRNFGNIFTTGTFTVEGETLEPQKLSSLSPSISLSSSQSNLSSGLLNESSNKSEKEEEKRQTENSVNWVFLINRSTPDFIIDLASSLQTQGMAYVVQEKQQQEVLCELGISCVYVTLGDSLSVCVRKNQRINSDGSLGFAPDFVVESLPESNVELVDDALFTALQVSKGALKVERVEKPVAKSYIHKSLDSDYSQNILPSVEYRYLSLFRLWNVVKFFFPYKNLLEKDWDEILVEFLSRVEGVKNALGYHILIAEMVAQLNDSHASVSSHLINSFVGTHVPPVETRMIEGKSVISFIFDPLLTRGGENGQEVNPVNPGLSVGDQILRIGTETVEDRKKKLSNIISASTPHALEHKIHQKLLAGEKDSAVIVEVLTREGMPITVTLPRTMLPSIRTNQRPAFSILPEGFGFIDTLNLIPEDVDKALESIKETKALILDIRGYPKGTIYQLAPRLTQSKVPVAVTQTPFLLPSMIYSELESCLLEEVHRLQPSPQWKYTGKVVVLINEETISHAEHSCLYLEAACNATFVGTPSNGANGNVTNLVLPGGLLVTFTGLGALHSNKQQLQRKGITPHILASPTVDDLVNGNDRIMQAAISYLQRELDPGFGLPSSPLPAKHFV